MKHGIVALLLACCAAASNLATAAEKHILMLLYRGCEESCQSFQAYFRKQNLSVRFTLRDAAQDKTRIPGFIAEARQLKPDLILSWGTTMTQMVAGTWQGIDRTRHIVDIPVVFMLVSNPLEAGLIRDLSRPGRPMTGTLYLLDEAVQLRAGRNYLDFRHLGLVVNPAEQNALTTRDQLRRLAKELGYRLSERDLPLDERGRPRAEDIPLLVRQLAAAGVDLLYQPPDSFLNQHRDLLTGSALACRLPVFASAEGPVVASGALMGVVNRYHEVGRHTAQQAARILFEHADPADLPITLPRRFSVLVNIRSARLLERYPPMKLLDYAEIVAASPALPIPNSCD